jgi:histidine triad (HIT) family protein
MSELSPEQQKMLDEQKKNCIFCKLISGEIPAKKVYEDDKVIALLDINPISKGHTLIMPKEHYPIMALIPPDVFRQMFEVSKELCTAIKKAVLKTGTTTFIANGQVAGQMSPHFMFHIIPREEGDNLDKFSKTGKKEKLHDQPFFESMRNNINIMMNNHFKRNPADWHNASPESNQEINSQKFTKEQVINVIEQNPQIKEFIINTPEVLIEQAKTNDQLKKLFADVDIHEIIKHYNPNYVIPEPKKEEENTDNNNVNNTDTAIEDPTQSAIKAAKSLQKPKSVFQILEENEKLKNLILNEPELFKQKVKELPQLQEIFNIDELDEIIKQVKEKYADKINQEEQQPKEDKTLEPKIQEKEQPKVTEKPEETQKDIFQVLEENEKLKNLILNEPELFKQKVKELPQLQEIFNIDELDEIIKQVKEKYADKINQEQQQPKENKTLEPKIQEKEQPKVTQKPEKTQKDIFQVLEENEKLKNLILNEPELFKQKVKELPQLQEIFNIDELDEIIKQVNEKYKNQIEDEKEPLDLENVNTNNQEIIQTDSQESNTKKGYYEKNDSLENLVDKKKEETKKKSNSEIIEIINSNPKLKNLLLNDFENFKQKISQIPELNELFKGRDIQKIIDELKEAEDEL